MHNASNAGRAVVCAVACVLLLPAGAFAAGAAQPNGQNIAASDAASNVPSTESSVKEAGDSAPVDATLEAAFPLADSPDMAKNLVIDAFKLIGGLQHIGDLTREHVEQQLGIQFLTRDDAHVSLPGSDYVWNRRLSSDWWMVGVNLDKGAESKRPRLLLSFLNIKNTGATWTPVCANLYEFAPAMVSSYGYKGRPIGTDPEHIRYLEYVRPQISDSPVVELYLTPEFPGKPNGSKPCLKSIVIL